MERSSAEEVATPAPPSPSGGEGPDTSIALSALEQKATREALAIWEAARGGRHMPSRADMPPRAMRKFLNVVALVEVIDGGAEFRSRVVGDGIATQLKLRVDGKTLAEIDAMAPGFGSFVREFYQRAMRHRAPLAYRGQYVRKADRHPFRYEVLILPLGDDGETVDHLVVVSV